MSQSVIQSHSYQFFENLQLSAREFYTMLEAMVKEYNYPEVECKVVLIKEEGWFSSNREYLRINKNNYNYYVCACPFGESFFISWWLKDQEGGLDAAINKVPWFGGLLSGKSRARTFYELDSELMFTQGIDAIIKLAVQKVAKDHGYRTTERETTTAYQ